MNQILPFVVFFFLCTMPFTRGNKRNRIAAFDLEEQGNVFTKQGDGGNAVKSEYMSYRKRLLEILKPGDHIAAERKFGTCDYEHHGIYESEKDRGYPSVIHFTSPTKSPVKESPGCTFSCGYKHPEHGGTVISCIDCFSNRQMMYKMQYKVRDKLLTRTDLVLNDLLEPGKLIAGYQSDKYYLEHKLHGKLYGHSQVSKDEYSKYTVEDRLRYYNISSNRSAEQVLEAARLSKFKPKTYSLVCQNCEHFAVFSKTGSTRSIQVEISNVRVYCEDGKSVFPFSSRGVKYRRQSRPIRQEVGSSEPMQVEQLEEPGKGSEQEKEPLIISAKRRKTS